MAIVRGFSSGSTRTRAPSHGFGSARPAAACAAAPGGLVSAVTPGSVSATTIASAKPVAGDLWPTFGQDPLHAGVSSDTAITASTAPSLNIRWSAPLSSTRDEPSPVVAYSAKLRETIVYATTFSGVISGFDAATGKLVWQRSLGSNVALVAGRPWRDPVHRRAKRDAARRLNAATGAVRCTFTLPVVAPATTPGRIYSSPVVGNIDGTGPDRFLRRCR